MGFYGEWLFPRVMDWVLRSPQFDEERRQALADAHGHVLEIGFGTGLNVPHYPPAVTRITALDPIPLVPHLVEPRLRNARMRVDVVRRPAEHLPFPDHLFDTVVSTWTLCSVSDPQAVLREVARVLKPGGSFLFLEHGRSDDAGTARWQDRVNPIQRIVGCGCNINRRIDALITAAGLRMTRLSRYHMPSTPRLVGEMYRGAATA